MPPPTPNPSSRVARSFSSKLKSFGKELGNILALALVWPCAALTWMEESLYPGRGECFMFWSQVFALLPGITGMYLRRAYYRWTLQYCAMNAFIGFGVLFSNRRSVIESEVYIGPYALVGTAVLRAKCLIGSRASILSGGQLHAQNALGDWLPADLTAREVVEIGENAWLGEGAIVRADVGPRAMVSAGAVVSAPVPERVMVAGNPARFVKRLVPEIARRDFDANLASPITNAQV